MSSQEPIRVVHVVSQLQTGGLEKLLVELGRHAAPERFAQVFVSLSGDGEIGQEIRSAGGEVICLHEASGLRPGLVLRLSRLFRRQGASVVHTHSTRPLIHAAPAARLARVPRVVHTRHGQRHGAGRGQTALYRWASRLVDVVVGVCDDGTALSAAEGVARHKLRTVHNGIDVTRFAYTGPDPAGPVVLVARLSPEKDIDSLIRAAAILAGRRPAFRLVIAGSGPCQARLQALIGALHLDGHVRLAGRVQDVAGLLAGASLFVLPSVTEGTSLTLLEAMARGLPVVATAVGGTPEVVDGGRCGLLVPPRSPGALAEAILALLADPHRARRMGQQGRVRVERRFDVRRMVREYESIYLGEDHVSTPLPPSSASGIRDRLEAPPHAGVLAPPGAEPVVQP